MVEAKVALRRSYHKFKWPVAWVFIYAILFSILSAFLNITNVSDTLLRLVLLGFLITFLSKIIHTAIYNRRLHFSWSFVFWGILNTWVIWFTTVLLFELGIISGIWIVLILGVLLVSVRWLVERISPSTSAKVVLVIVLVLITFLFDGRGDTSSLTEKATSQGNSLLSRLAGAVQSLKSAFNSCPQLDVPIEDLPQNYDGFQKGIFVHTSKYEDWIIKKHQMTSLSMPIGPRDGIPCVKGKAEGQNLNYWYCGYVTGTGFFGLPTSSSAPYMERTVIQSDGTIGNTIRKGFRNVYDIDGTFIRTECSADPVAQDEKNVKEFANWLMNN